MGDGLPGYNLVSMRCVPCIPPQTLWASLGPRMSVELHAATSADIFFLGLCREDTEPA